MIYILGGRGFVGSAFARACEAAGGEYRIIDRENYSRLAGSSCDLFINAAGNSKKFLSGRAPLRDFDASVRSVRSSLTDFGFKRFVLISSADVYPDSSAPETTSEDRELDVARMSAYGFHKYLAELCVRHAARDWLIVRCGGFVGPGLRKNAVFDILNGGPLWLDPKSELQYIHTDQAAAAVLRLADLGVAREIVNLCARGVVSLSQVMGWAGREVAVEAGSPLIRCELDLSRALSFVELPETAHAVRQFVASHASEGDAAS